MYALCLAILGNNDKAWDRERDPKRGLATLASAGGAALTHVNPRSTSCVVLGGVNDALLDVGCQVEKRLVDIDVALGRDFHERDAKFVGKRLALLSRDCPLLLPIAFVANQNLVDALGGVLFHVGEPGSDV